MLTMSPQHKVDSKYKVSLIKNTCFYECEAQPFNQLKAKEIRSL